MEIEEVKEGCEWRREELGRREGRRDGWREQEEQYRQNGRGSERRRIGDTLGWREERYGEGVQVGGCLGGDAWTVRDSENLSQPQTVRGEASPLAVPPSRGITASG
ncbi:hypothetical protein O3P69_009823 [Scylla paramamosain]|uniref:Uncharacterized protein n=1 Tax=Scylla paramamosain TaxID=85552 RepID=A0AAW0SNF6_SCYPA